MLSVARRKIENNDICLTNMFFKKRNVLHNENFRKMKAVFFTNKKDAFHIYKVHLYLQEIQYKK